MEDRVPRRTSVGEVGELSISLCTRDNDLMNHPIAEALHSQLTACLSPSNVPALFELIALACLKSVLMPRIR